MTADDLVDKYPALFASAFPSIGEGWLPLLETLCSRIELHYKWKEQGGVKIIEAEEEPPEDGKYLHRFYFSQIKEKFRGLRAYSYGGDEYTQGLVDMAEAVSYHICENCSNAGSEKGEHWIRTLCDPCHDDWENIRETNWQKEKAFYKNESR